MKTTKLLISALLGLSLSLPSAAASATAITTESMQEGVYNVSFPQFIQVSDKAVADRINHDIELDIKSILHPIIKEESPKVQEGKIWHTVYLMNNDFVSYETLSYIYTGGAHGITSAAGHTRSLKSGNECKLSDFYKGSLAEINQKISAYAKTNNIPLFSDFKGITKMPTNFYLDQNQTPVLIFGQYEIAPYSSGIIRVPLK